MPTPEPVSGQVFDLHERELLRQGLKQRHIQMIALAGTIGTGLFLSSGQVISQSGPAGAIIGYSVIGLLVSGVLVSIAELSALLPLSGGIIRHAERIVDPALSFAQGWNTVYAYFISIPGEIVAATVLVQFWISVNSAIWITVFGGLLILCNLSLIRIYGELEFSFAILKIMLIVGLNLMALVLVCGGGPTGEVYGVGFWRNPGPFTQYLNIPGALGQFLGVWRAFTPAVYSYASVENVTLLAGETQNPRKNIPRAAKRIVWRVIIFYVITIFMITLLVPSNDPNLLKSTGTAAQSPFVLAADRAGVAVVPSIINFVVLTSAWGSGNSILMGGSRVLLGLSQEKHAPAFVSKVNRLGVPYVSVAMMSLSICLGYLTVSSGAATVFTWLQNLIAAFNYIAWMIICIVYLRFYYAMKKQGISRDELPWKAPLQPWSTQIFLSAYLDIAIVLVLYLGYKVWKKTKLIPLDEVPLRYYLDQAHRNPEPPDAKKSGWGRLNILWG
ncbi:amino acid permease/ SLC12A domain-containing protein [Aspergillus alliaceus]|uniref:amino acid permease/ SLC12A domain-containing protein n=1 Tax=Petromyces alliaceus TaxID=209559 RepID=UPI0012A423E5|nr:amino acid permease/ SLC12A domain-containing protein [Aspergillus alliaceus]KAB8228875.1 amino acid permease/ SLC12A domain-containing protein [Aspergillus alliaceus]